MRTLASSMDSYKTRKVCCCCCCCCCCCRHYLRQSRRATGILIESLATAMPSTTNRICVPSILATLAWFHRIRLARYHTRPICPQWHGWNSWVCNLLSLSLSIARDTDLLQFLATVTLPRAWARKNTLPPLFDHRWSAPSCNMRFRLMTSACNKPPIGHNKRLLLCRANPICARLK
jgi:hypothetical protein